MKNKKRAVFFFILVILPVSVILFLRFFGENKFDLPVYYQEDIPTGIDCKIVAPHSVSLGLDDINYGEIATVVAFLESPKYDPELQRIDELLKDSDVISLVVVSRIEGIGYLVDEEVYNELITCQFLKESTRELVEDTKGKEILLPIFLIDDQKRIRGLYRGEDKIDIDRLVTEVEILKTYHD